MRGTLIVALIACALAVSSCGRPPRDEPAAKPAEQPAAKSSAPPQQTEWDKTLDRELAKQAKREEEKFPCRLFTQQQIADLVGGPVERAQHAFEHKTEDERQWRADACTWSSADGNGTSVLVWVSGPKHFDSGQVTCHAPLGGAKQIDGVGNTAWWAFMKSFGWGTMRACSSQALVEVRIKKPGGSDAEVQQIARAVAETLLK